MKQVNLTVSVNNPEPVLPPFHAACMIQTQVTQAKDLKHILLMIPFYINPFLFYFQSFLHQNKRQRCVHVLTMSIYVLSAELWLSGRVCPNNLD